MKQKVTRRGREVPEVFWKVVAWRLMLDGEEPVRVLNAVGVAGYRGVGWDDVLALRLPDPAVAARVRRWFAEGLGDEEVARRVCGLGRSEKTRQRHAARDRDGFGARCGKGGRVHTFPTPKISGLRGPPAIEVTEGVRPLIATHFLALGAGTTATSFDPPGFEGAATFLSVLVGEHHISDYVAEQASKLLRQILVGVHGLGVPRIAPGADGMVGMTWERGAHHVNVEVFSDGHVEFFYEDSGSGALWEEEHPSTTVTSELLTRLRRTTTA